MFKKSLIAVAVLGATAFSVQAADVTMYGKVDTGLQFKTNEVTEGNQTVTDTDTFSMENGLNSASRFGIKGSEDLGNGMKVSFQLENGFKSDSGEFKTEGKLFDRQATVAVSSDFGTLTMGRVGGIGSGAGFDLVYGYGDAFDGGSLNVLGLAKSDRYDNMVTYQTPKFAGMQATVQYSFQGSQRRRRPRRLLRRQPLRFRRPDGQLRRPGTRFSPTNSRTMIPSATMVAKKTATSSTSAATTTAASPRPS
ncbi:MAG: porin [Sutterella wadsworthensis]